MGFQASATEKPVFELIPEDTLQRVRLLEVTARPIKTKRGDSTILNWKFEITSSVDPSEGDFTGKWVYGSTFTDFHPGAKFYEWSQTLLGREIPTGMLVDTDELLGLTAEVVIGHRADRNDPEKKYVEVAELLPADSDSSSWDSEPPF